MQLMPRTASALGVLDRFDPRENIRGGVRHLRYLLDRYRGNVAMAIAAYNAGTGAVDFHRGIPPYPETEQYVQRVRHHWAAAPAPITAAPRSVKARCPPSRRLLERDRAAVLRRDPLR